MGNCCFPKLVDIVPNNNTRPATPANNRNNNPPPAVDECAGGGEGGGVPPSGQIITPNLKNFTFVELKSATKNFQPATVLGEGGFGRVFKGWIDEKTYAPSRVGLGIPVAVKKSNPDSEQGLKEWQAEVKFLGKFKHPNLVRLLGYCWEDKQFLLVYEYMKKGSLENHLFRKGSGEPIPWDIRIKIAIGAAHGLAFLHSTEKQVIYRDFKSSNILLDEDFNAKLSDFGLAKLGPEDGDSHVTTKVLGTYGYAAPEYMATGHLYVKSDVYGFGVVLLEIITGLRVMDLNRPNPQINLVDWARPQLADKKKVRKLVDPRLEGRYPSKGVYQIAELILNCTEPNQKSRPTMDVVLESLEQIKHIQTKSKELQAKSKHDQRNANHHHHHQRSPRGTYYENGGARANNIAVRVQVHDK